MTRPTLRRRVKRASPLLRPCGATVPPRFIAFQILGDAKGRVIFPLCDYYAGKRQISKSGERKSEKFLNREKSATKSAYQDKIPIGAKRRYKIGTRKFYAAAVSLAAWRKVCSYPVFNRRLSNLVIVSHRACRATYGLFCIS
jgi:hypothetical protein